jgi:hypothetical protein
MPTGLEVNEFFMRCACHASDHCAMLTHEPDSARGNNISGVDDEWYLSVRLDQFGFWKRFRTGLRYIFSPYSIKYGTSVEIVLRNEDIAALEDFIMRRRNPGTPP